MQKLLMLFLFFGMSRNNFGAEFWAINLPIVMKAEGIPNTTTTFNDAFSNS